MGRLQMQRWLKIGFGALLVALAVLVASWRIGQRPYVTPGTHQIFRMDSTPGALFEFLVLLSLVFAGAITLFRAARGGKAFFAIAGSYVAALILVSLLSPAKAVSVGDSYCWDLWCVGVQQVNKSQQGQSILYTADVALFADSSNPERIPSGQGKQFFYVVDDHGRRFEIREASFRHESDILNPGESVKSTLVFLAPPDAGKLYLTGDLTAPLWVRLYFGSDLNPFHRRTLLRVT
jgi:hypothetical protein